MGCATSVLPLNKANGVGGQFSQASQENEQELAQFNAPAPKITINVGSGMKKYQEGQQNIVFVFGGPFSMKGLLVEDLVQAFNFTVITTEDIVLSYLPNRVANTVQTTQEIKELLQTDPTLLNLDWVLNLSGARLTTNSQRMFILDIVPNMYTILRLENFNKPDIRKEMTDFERRFPVLFALNLVVHEDGISDAKTSPGFASKMVRHPQKIIINSKKDGKDGDNVSTASGATTTTTASTDGDETTAAAADGSATSSKGTEKKDEKNKSLFSEGADEMDSSRLKRRHDLYRSCADPFINYFEESKRLVTLHVVPAQREFVWKRLQEFFREVGFPCKQAGRTVILFAFNEEQVEGLDTLYYKMLKVSLSAIIGNKNDTLENMMRAVAMYVKRASSSTSNHLIILDCLNSRSDSGNPRKINFLEIKECYLDQFIRIKSSAVAGKPFRRRFKAISTTNNEVCLFPLAPEMVNGVVARPSTGGFKDNLELCKKIAFSYLIADQSSMSSSNLENGGGGGGNSGNTSANSRVNSVVGGVRRQQSKFVVDRDDTPAGNSTDNEDLNLSTSNNHNSNHTISVVTSVS